MRGLQSLRNTFTVQAIDAEKARVKSLSYRVDTAYSCWRPSSRSCGHTTSMHGTRTECDKARCIVTAKCGATLLERGNRHAKTTDLDSLVVSRRAYAYCHQ
jgi:hypothetical protein